MSPSHSVLPSGISILRPVGAVPASEMAAVHEAAATVAYAHIFDTPFPVEEARDRWAAHDGEVRLAWLGAVLVGFATATDDELIGLFVLPMEQGSGLGTALLAALPEVRRAWVLEDASRTRRWYERRGWRPTAERQPAYGVWDIRYVR